MKKGNSIIRASLLATAMTCASTWVQAADYLIDTKGAHAFIQFKIQHLGYSWLYGRFNDFDGQFSFDPSAPEASKITVNIDPSSVDSNHAERDKHLRDDDFLDVKKYPKAKFVSKRVESTGDGKAKVTGDLTLKDVTREIVIDAELVGMGKDPWGGERAGFQGSTRFALKDFNIMKDLGPLSQEVEMILSIEGIKQ
ncbi:MAG: YceI family protein [Oleiphilus sp.]|nr:MAG: YceI family protein [Oleiphilus sp.]